MPHACKKMISFFLTTKCNLCCRYCYNAKERNSIQEQSLSFNIARHGIDRYFEKNNSRHIRFYGPGEPTQEFETLKRITEYAKQHHNRGEDVTVEIQTNGIFTSDVREWALNNINIMWMSFDGMREIQEYNRPLNPKYYSLFDGRSSAEILEDNVKWLIQISKAEKKDLMVGARITITDKNVSLQKEMIDYFYDLGIRYAWTNPLFYSVGKIPVLQDERKKSSYHFDFDLYLSQYVSAYRYAQQKGMFWGSFFSINFDGESTYHCRSCIPQEAPHLTPDGYVSACDMVVLGSNPYHMSPFIIGKWNEDISDFEFSEEKIRQLNIRKSTNMRHCNSCPAQLHCGGYCLGETVNETGSLYGYNETKCNAIRKLLREIGTCEPYKYLHP